MKRAMMFLAMVAVVAASGMAYSFTSSDVYVRGKVDNEYTRVTAGRDIDAGQWVVMSYSAALTDDGLDTCSIVTLNDTENQSSVVGLAMHDADTGAYLTVLTYGYASIAKVDGEDSDGNTLVRNHPLAITARAGYAGGYQYEVRNRGVAAPAGTQRVGYLIDAVTGAQSGGFADTSTAYHVLVNCR